MPYANYVTRSFVKTYESNRQERSHPYCGSKTTDRCSNRGLNSVCFSVRYATALLHLPNSLSEH